MLDPRRSIVIYAVFTLGRWLSENDVHVIQPWIMAVCVFGAAMELNLCDALSSPARKKEPDAMTFTSTVTRL